MKRHVILQSFAATALLATAGRMACGVEAPAGVNPQSADAIRSAGPLLPPRQGPAERSLRSAVDQYPHLTEGAERDGTTVIAVVLQADGGILDSRQQHVDLVQQQPLVEGELQHWLPVADGDGVSRQVLSKGTSIAGSRPLRTNVVIISTQLPPGFDPRRAAQRVSGIVRQERAELFLPLASGERNRLMVLLAEDGTILEQDVQRYSQPDIRPAPNDGNQEPGFAQIMAGVLGISEDRIGVMGATTVLLQDRAIFVVYAWQRGAGETAPRIYGRPPAAASFDDRLALELVRRHLPGTFSGSGGGAGTPVMLLSPAGEVLRSGHVPMRSGGLTRETLQNPLLEDVQIASVALRSIRNDNGTAREVLFVWGIPGRPAAARETRP